MDEMSIEEARPRLGDIVRDAQQHGITTRITRNGKPAAIVMPIEDGRRLAEIRDLLAAFDWETSDRQYALERIEMIAGGGQP